MRKQKLVMRYIFLLLITLSFSGFAQKNKKKAVDDSNFKIDSLPNILLRELNRYRAEKGLDRLEFNTRMNEAAYSILGIHDFQSFCKTDTEVDHFRCQIFESRWYEEHHKLVYRVRANRFLYGMVRALVGTMVNVGRGFTHPNGFQEIIDAKNRSTAGQAAPAKGLFLERVIY